MKNHNFVDVVFLYSLLSIYQVVLHIWTLEILTALINSKIIGNYIVLANTNSNNITPNKQTQFYVCNSSCMIMCTILTKLFTS